MHILHIYRRSTYLIGILTLGCITARSGLAQANIESTKPQISIDSAAPWSAAESGWRGRLVIGEYATAVYCGECQSDDDMYNKLLQRYPRTAFVSLAYHIGLGLPITDRTEQHHLLTRLVEWFGSDYIRPYSGQFPGKPTFFNNWLDGKTELNWQKPEVVVNSVDAELKRPPEAFFHVQAKVVGGRIVARVKIDSVTGKHPKTYLRLVVVEDTVNLIGDGEYEQRPGVAQIPRLVQHMVVRAFAYTDKLSLGLPLRAPSTVEYTFDMTAIQDRLVKYHRFGIDSMVPWANMKTGDTWNPTSRKQTEEQLAKFPDERDWRMDPLRLHVVAFVQDAQTAEVLQAAMVKLDPAQARRLLPAKVQATLILKTKADSTLASYWGYKELKD